MEILNFGIRCLTEQDRALELSCQLGPARPRVKFTVRPRKLQKVRIKEKRTIAGDSTVFNRTKVLNLLEGCGLLIGQTAAMHADQDAI